MTRLWVAMVGGFGILTSLSGCAFLQALSFQEHPASHVPGGKVEVWLVRRLSEKEATERKPVGQELTKKFMENADWCYKSISEGMRPQFAPLAGAALTAVAGMVIGLVGDEIAGYVDKQAKTFTSTFGTAVNHDYLFAKRDGFALDFDCIVVRQMIKEDKDSTEKDKPVGGFDFAAVLVPSRGVTPQAYTLVPVFYRMTRSSARTGLKGTVDVTVAITISAVMSEAAGKKLVTLADRTIVLPEVSLPKPDEKGKVPLEGEEKRAKTGDMDRLGPVNASTWFSLASAADGEACMKDDTCRGILPVSVGVKVTEVGTGSPDYGLASKEAGDLAKTIGDGISKIINSVTSK